jgi:hypothetical protein
MGHSSEGKLLLAFLPGPVLRLRNRLGTSPACPLAGYGGLGAVVGPGTYSATGTSPKVLSDDKEMQCSAAHPVVVRPGAAIRGALVPCNIR